MYIKRSIEEILNSLKNEYFCITIYGARQIGKSTLALELFKDFNYVTLDSLQTKTEAETNPKIFLENHPFPLIIDEIQKVPSLLDEIKVIIDNEKFKCLKENSPSHLLFLLTGSNQFTLQKSISDSLAGRTAILKMSTLSYAEIINEESVIFKVDFDSVKNKNKNYLYQNRKAIFERIFKGGMPEYITKNLNREIFFNSYINTYIEKDIKNLISIKKEKEFLKFLEFMALRTAQQLNYEDISRNLGIDYRTVKEWISILINSGIAFTLKPYFNNLSNRISKSEKFYFFDTGLCSFLCKWQDAEMLEKGIMSGAFFETYVISEIVKSYINNGKDYSFYLHYYKDRDQKEINLIIEENNSIYPVEIKKGINPINNKFNFNFLKKHNKNLKMGALICSDIDVKKINDNVFTYPIHLIGIK